MRKRSYDNQRHALSITGVTVQELLQVWGFQNLLIEIPKASKYADAE